MQNDETFQSIGMGEKKMKEVKEQIKGQVSAFEDLIRLKQKKDGGVSLKDALFKAAGSAGTTEEQNQNMKVNKILSENLREKQDEDDEDPSKNVLNEDEILLQDDNQNQDPL